MNSGADAFSAVNPLEDEFGTSWARLVEAVGPASLIVIIQHRMSKRLLRLASPEDVLQETLLVAWRDRKQCQWRGLRSFRTWLLGIIDHQIADMAKFHDADKRSPPLPNVSLVVGTTTGASLPPEVAATTTPSRIGMHREQAERMRLALECLPESLREIVYMRLMEQRTVPEIASLLEVSEKAVRYRFYKGAELFRARLRTIVSSRWTIPSDSRAAGAADIAPNLEGE